MAAPPDDVQLGSEVAVRSPAHFASTSSDRCIACMPWLGGARLESNLQMAGASLDGELDAPSLRVGGSLVLDDATARGFVNLSSAQIGGDLVPLGVTFRWLDLQGAAVAGALKVGSGAKLPSIETMDLRNAHAGTLWDDGGKNPWPTHLRLDGFAFSRLGNEEMVTKRSSDWWDGLARRDDKNSFAYEQLAAAFAAIGEHEAADEIHSDEQARADENAKNWWDKGRSFVLRWGAGYGIGSYMFCALFWALVLSALGAFILKHGVKGVAEAGHSLIWCFGASVNRHLPIVSLKKEFADFFEDPARHKFTPQQDFFFTVLGLLGWLLGAIVLAAVATFTHTAAP